MKIKKAPARKIKGGENAPRPEISPPSPYSDTLGMLFSKPPAPVAPPESVEIEESQSPTRLSRSPGFMSAREKRMRGLTGTEVLNEKGMSEEELYLHKKYAEQLR